MTPNQSQTEKRQRQQFNDCSLVKALNMQNGLKEVRSEQMAEKIKLQYLMKKNVKISKVDSKCLTKFKTSCQKQLECTQFMSKEQIENEIMTELKQIIKNLKLSKDQDEVFWKKLKATLKKYQSQSKVLSIDSLENNLQKLTQMLIKQGVRVIGYKKNVQKSKKGGEQSQEKEQ